MSVESSQSRISSRRNQSGKLRKTNPSANIKNASQVSRRKPKHNHMSASYSAVKKGSSKGRESLRNKRKRNEQWKAPESLARAGSKKKSSSPRGKGYDKKKSVSYTHLTLPTICSV